MRLGVLGPIEAWDVLGRPVRITRGQSRVLAVLLDAANEVVAAHVIQEKLWPGDDPEDSKDLLHTNVWTLRNLFGRDAEPDATPALLRRGEGYELRVDPLQLDWTRYQRLVAAAGRAITSGRNLEAKLFLLDAQRLWRGDALVGLHEDFAAPFAQLLEESRGATRLQLIDVSLALGEHLHLLPQLRHLTGKDPLNESLTRRLMLALFRSGRQAEALEAYDACRRRLADSGLVPTTQLTSTEVEILTHAPSAMAPVGGPAPAQSWSDLSGTLLVGKWPAAKQPATWWLGDSELVLLAEDDGGEVLEVEPGSFVACFDDVGGALATAVAIQRELKGRKGALGRFVVHDGSQAATRGVRLRSLAEQLLSESESGQILVFRSAAESDARRPPEGSELVEVGRHHFHGGDPAVRVFQLVAPQVVDAARPFAPVALPPSHNLPEPGDRIVGRDHLVERVAEVLSRRRLVTLTGPGGVGKSRVALEVARDLASEYRDGTWRVELEWLRDPELIAGTVADAMGIDRPRSLNITDVVLRELTPRHILIVLDTCEHLVASVREFIDELLARCPRASVIATSLRPLACDQEDVIVVPPLALPPPGGPQLSEREIRANPSVHLFCDRLGAAVSSADLSHVSRICRLLEGVPLTIMLAAARARHLGLAHLARELERTFADGGVVALLDAGGRLRKTLAWTFSLLEEREHRVLTQLALFTGSFTLDEAKEFCEGTTGSDVAAILCRLADCSAIVVEDDAQGGTRYRLLRAVREFGEAVLAEDLAERERLCAKHAGMYLRIAQEADAAFGRHDEDGHLQRLDERLGNMRSAVSWSIAAGRGDLALALGAALWRYWFARGRLVEGRRCLLELLAMEHERSSAGIRVLGGSSYLSWWLGDLEYTSKSAEETAQLADTHDDGWGRAWAPLGLLAAGMFSPAGPPPGLDLRPAIDWFIEAGLAWEAAQALQLLAGIDWHGGDIAAASARFGRAVELSRAAGG